MRLSMRSTASRSSSTSRMNSAARNGVTSIAFSSVRYSAAFSAHAHGGLFWPRGGRPSSLRHAMRRDIHRSPGSGPLQHPSAGWTRPGNDRGKIGYRDDFGLRQASSPSANTSISVRCVRRIVTAGEASGGAGCNRPSAATENASRAGNTSNSAVLPAW